MKNILRTATLIALLSALVAGCGKAEDETLNKRMPEQRQQADKLYEMGEPTDRSKSKGY